MIDAKELEDRIFESFYICNEMGSSMARDYARRAADIAVKMSQGKARTDYFNPRRVPTNPTTLQSIGAL